MTNNTPGIPVWILLSNFIIVYPPIDLQNRRVGPYQAPGITIAVTILRVVQFLRGALGSCPLGCIHSFIHTLPSLKHGDRGIFWYSEF